MIVAPGHRLRSIAHGQDTRRRGARRRGPRPDHLPRHARRTSRRPPAACAGVVRRRIPPWRPKATAAWWRSTRGEGSPASPTTIPPVPMSVISSSTPRDRAEASAGVARSRRDARRRAGARPELLRRQRCGAFLVSGPWFRDLRRRDDRSGGKTGGGDPFAAPSGRSDIVGPSAVGHLGQYPTGSNRNGPTRRDNIAPSIKA